MFTRNTNSAHLFRSHLFILIFFCFLSVTSMGALFSQDLAGTEEDSSAGKEKNPYLPVEGRENWSHELNVENLSPGIYNFIVEGTDKAGNKAYSDPINVYVDPESDKPVVGISHPEPGMVVSGKLNIIGTAVDDDGIASVEVKINDSSYTAAEGKEFWSYYLDTADLEDGPLLLTVRATDINGIQGNEKSLSFVLDRSLPANEITSHKNGDLVHGKIKVEGTTSDGNGIDKVEMSLDGETYREISWKQIRKEAFGTFSFTLDTRTIEDGARVVWIRSTDDTGSVGLSSFLLFVDNNPPALDILFPREEESIDGHFTVVGTALDDIGLESLAFRIGKEEAIDIPLIPGDPYWSVSFDREGESRADIRFILTDLTGNVVETRLLHDFDLEADTPVVELISPRWDESYTSPVFAGFVSDDDGDVEIAYSLDGDGMKQISASYSFNLSFEGLSSGNHRLEFYGIDRYGRESEPVRVDFSVVDRAPQLALDSFEPLEKEGASLPFEQALELEPETWNSLSGRVSFLNGEGSVKYSLDGSEEKTLSLHSDPSGEKTFRVPLKDVPAGYHALTLTAVDKAGLSQEHSFYFTIRGAGGSRLRYGDDRFNDSGALKSSALLMDEKDRVAFYWEGFDAPSSAELSRDVPFLKSAVRDNRVFLESTGPGYAEDVSIAVVMKSGKEHILGPFTVVSDSKAPEISLDMDNDVIQGPGDITLNGSVRELAALDKLTVTVNGNRESALALEDGRFTLALNLENIPDGNIVLTFRALDRSGRSSEKYYLFRKDREPLKIKQLAPLAGRGANGAVSFAGLVDDPAMLASVEYSADGIQFVPLNMGGFVKTQLDLTPLDGEAGERVVSPRTIRLRDKAGNETLYEPEILLDDQGDKPVVIIQIPGEDSLMQEDFTVSGMAFDDDEVASLYYRIDGGVEKELSGVNSFELPLSLKDLADNGHLLEIRAVDLNGIEGDWASLSFRVSHSEPASRMELPILGVFVRGVIDIRGYSEDPNGMDSVYISFDNGNSYDEMETEARGELLAESEGDNTGMVEGESVSWSYSYNTNQLEDGSHSILFKGVDRYGVTGLYTSLMTIDNTPPSLEIREPREGMEFSGLVDLEGFLDDNGELALAYVEIQPLAEPELTRVVELPLESLVRGSLDMGDLPAGWINLRITVEDVTGNVTHISRNISKMDSLPERRVTLITPSRGSRINGDILVQGMVENVDAIESVQLSLNGIPQDGIVIKDSGFFSALIGSEELREGEYDISAQVRTEKGDTIESGISHFYYKKTGPWISLEGFTAGDYAADRPWLTGKAGYEYIAPPLEEKELKSFEKSKAVDLVEISLDNGKTFAPVSGREEWKYRLETQEIGNGEHWIILRARFKDGTSALERTVLVVDETPPRIDLLTPDEGFRFNDLAMFTGTASDNNGLKSVEASLREGNKNHYQVPAFIQGLFIDFHVLGSTVYEGGLGLTFFEDNVKLQVLAGSAPEGRFNGKVAGLKLLANVASLPWEYFFGYDFERFSSSFAVGTTFQYFTMENSPSPDASSIMLGAMLAQAELVKFNKPEWNKFSSFSLYMEMQLWVISSDVEAGLAPRVALGVRTNVF